MKILFSYNFNIDDIKDGDFKRLYAERRRDAAFACAYENEDGNVVAFTDHLGNVPLYFRFGADKLRIGTGLSDVAQAGDVLEKEGLLYFLSIGTAKLAPLLRDGHIVPPGTALKIDPVSKKITLLYRYDIPHQEPQKAPIAELIEELDAIFIKALERTVKNDTVGLYLSGGIDSALVGFYLRRVGVKVNAYTAAPWGKNNEETACARKNASLFEATRHEVVEVEPKKYQEYLEMASTLYGTAHGTATALGVASLWSDSKISSEKQVYFAQNTDTMTCSMPHQYYTYFLQFLPRFLRRRFHLLYRHETALENYLSFVSRGRLSRFQRFEEQYSGKNYSTIEVLTLAGMYIGHTPPDGEVLSAPVVQSGAIFSNPYYDMDMVEFCMRLPLALRLGFTKHSKMRIALKKRIFQELAKRYLPPEMIYRKKGFIVPFSKVPDGQQFFKSLPNSVAGITLNGPEERIAAAFLRDWRIKYGVNE